MYTAVCIYIRLYSVQYLIFFVQLQFPVYFHVNSCHLVSLGFSPDSPPRFLPILLFSVCLARFRPLFVSSQDVLAGIAADLGVNVEDLDFADLAFYQGSEFPIEKEFDMGSVELSSVRGEPGAEINPAPPARVLHLR